MLIHNSFQISFEKNSFNPLYDVYYFTRMTYLVIHIICLNNIIYVYEFMSCLRGDSSLEKKKKKIIHLEK